MILIQVRNHLLESFQSNFFVIAAQKALGSEVGLRFAAGWGAEEDVLLRLGLCSAAFVCVQQTWRASPVIRECRHISKFIWIRFNELSFLQHCWSDLENTGENCVMHLKFLHTGNSSCSFFFSFPSQICNGNLSSFCPQLHLEVLSICRCAHGFRMFALEY